MDVQIVTRDRVTYAGDLPVSSYTQTCAAAREYGTATTDIPFDHPAFRAIPTPGSSAYLSIRHGALGSATYLLLDDPQETATGYRCTWSDPLMLMATLEVQNRETFIGVPAGTIAATAIRRAVQGRAGVPFAVGSIYRGSPISAYEIRGGETLEHVLSDLADRVPEEWSLSGDGRRLNWQPVAGALWPEVLVDGVTCVRLRPPAGHDERVGRVIAYDQHEIAAVAEAPEFYHDLGAVTKVIRVDAPSSAAHQQAAADELARLSTRRRTYEIGLLAPTTTLIAGMAGGSFVYGAGVYGSGVYGGSSPGSPAVVGDQIAHWAIQPGDLVKLILTSGAATEHLLVRVLARTFGDGHPIPTYRVQTIRHYTSTTIHSVRYGAGPLTAPPKTLPRELAASRFTGNLTEAAQILRVPTARLNEPVPAALIEAVNAAQVVGTLATDQIADAAITDAKIAAVAATKVTGTLATGQIANSAITDAKIADVAASKITGTVATTQIANNAVTDAKIAAVDAAKLTTGTLPAARIAAASLDVGKVNWTVNTSPPTATAEGWIDIVVGGTTYKIHVQTAS